MHERVQIAIGRDVVERTFDAHVEQERQTLDLTLRQALILRDGIAPCSIRSARSTSTHGWFIGVEVLHVRAEEVVSTKLVTLALRDDAVLHQSIAHFLDRLHSASSSGLKFGRQSSKHCCLLGGISFSHGRFQLGQLVLSIFAHGLLHLSKTTEVTTHGLPGISIGDVKALGDIACELSGELLSFTDSALKHSPQHFQCCLIWDTAELEIARTLRGDLLQYRNILEDTAPHGAKRALSQLVDLVQLAACHVPRTEPLHPLVLDDSAADALLPRHRGNLPRHVGHIVREARLLANDGVCGLG